MEGREEGKIFELVFERQARRLGLLPIKNHLTCKFVPNRRPLILKSELDYKLVEKKTGRIGYFDCKSYGKDFFTYSELDPEQVKRAALYEEWNVPSGFVVFFRPTSTVRFFTASYVLKKGPGNRFSVNEGVGLGRWDNFELRGLMREGRPVSQAPETHFSGNPEPSIPRST